MATTRRPTSVVIRSYQVGFGDCFLLSVLYGEEPGAAARHVLIDFGSTGRPKVAPSAEAIADDIAKVTGGRLHAVVATHRHADHISGFAGESGRKIAGLKPDVVVQPWTEDPDAKTKATAPTIDPGGRKGFVASLARMHDVARHSLAELDRFTEPGQSQARRGITQQIRFLGESNLANLDAVRTLMKMGSRHVYAYYGSRSGLETVLPGVTTHVLGPPTLDQSTTIKKQRSKDADEFWHFQALATGRGAGTSASLFRPRLRVSPGKFPETRWFLPRLHVARREQALEIVRILDKAMNNTSLILLFEVNGTRLLFPGDAQIENWLYALEGPDRAKVRKLLAGVNVYKVGHHGSLNATPKTLWGLLRKKGGPRKRNRLQTLMSTMAGKHGSDDRGTEVPRKKLVAELEKQSALFSTQTLTKKNPFVEVTRIKV